MYIAIPTISVRQEFSSIPRGTGNPQGLKAKIYVNPEAQPLFTRLERYLMRLGTK